MSSAQDACTEPGVPSFWTVPCASSIPITIQDVALYAARKPKEVGPCPHTSSITFIWDLESNTGHPPTDSESGESCTGVYVLIAPVNLIVSNNPRFLINVKQQPDT